MCMLVFGPPLLIWVCCQIPSGTVSFPKVGYALRKRAIGKKVGTVLEKKRETGDARETESKRAHEAILKSVRGASYYC